MVTDSFVLGLMNADPRFSHVDGERAASVKSVDRDVEQIELVFKGAQTTWWVDWHDVRMWNALDRLAAIPPPS